jgi:hypothetical protein
MGPVRLSWDDHGETRYTIAKCIDVSESGLRFETPAPIPAHAELVLNAERIEVSGSARVRHVTRHGAKYIIGVELSGALRAKALASIREPWALRAPSGIV